MRTFANWKECADSHVVSAKEEVARVLQALQQNIEFEYVGVKRYVGVYSIHLSTSHNGEQIERCSMLVHQRNGEVLTATRMIPTSAHVHEHSNELVKIGQPMDSEHTILRDDHEGCSLVNESGEATPLTVHMSYNPLVHDYYDPKATMRLPEYDTNEHKAVIVLHSARYLSYGMLHPSGRLLLSDTFYGMPTADHHLLRRSETGGIEWLAYDNVVPSEIDLSAFAAPSPHDEWLPMHFGHAEHWMEVMFFHPTAFQELLDANGP